MFVVLLFGGLTMATAAVFVWRPAERHVATIRSLSTATVFSVLTGLASNLAAVFSHVPTHPEWSKSPEMPLIVMTGLAESLAPVLLGFAMLTLAWGITAVGLRRLGAAIA